MWEKYPDQNIIDDYAHNISSEIIRKWELGAIKYGKTFNGLPVPQLFEELADAMVYLYYSNKIIAEAVDIIEMMHGKSFHVLSQEENNKVMNYLSVYYDGLKYHSDKDSDK